MKKIESTKKIPHSTQLRVYRRGYGYGRGSVIVNHDSFLAVAIDGDFVETLRKGSNVEVYLWVDNSAAYEFESSIRAYIDDNDESIVFLSHTYDITFKEERQCLEADVDFNYDFFLFDTGKLQAGFSSDEVITHSAKALRLSDREIVIESTEILPDNILAYGHIPVYENDIEAVGRIKTIRKPEKGNPGEYRISFVSVSDEQRNSILDYVYDVYRE